MKFLQNIFGINNKKTSTTVNFFIDGKKVEKIGSRKILKKANLVDELELPEFSSEFDKKIKIQDQKDLRYKFEVNLFKVECNCSEFKEHKSSYRRGDIRRVCQHLSEAICEEIIKENGFLAKCIKKYYQKPENHFYLVQIDVRHIIYFDEASSWVNVFSENKPEVEYAYSLRETRWSNKGIPEHSSEIIKEIFSIISV